MLSKSYSNLIFECGTDEAGRGCLAGPVTAAAAISPLTPEGGITNDAVKRLFEELNDSKQLSDKKRFELRPLIEQTSISFGFTHIYNEEIDEINILNASIILEIVYGENYLKNNKQFLEVL